MRAAIRRATLVVAFSVVAASALACGGAGGPVTIPASIGPDRTVTPVVDGTRAEIARALGERSIILDDLDTPFRPAEGPILSYAPRAVFQAQLPADPDAGIIVVYEFADPGAAAAAAGDQAAYLGSGPGRVQYPDAARHVIRVVNSTVILYTWIPESAEDPLTPDVAASLSTLGAGVDVPR